MSDEGFVKNFQGPELSSYPTFFMPKILISLICVEFFFESKCSLEFYGFIIL